LSRTKKRFTFVEPFVWPQITSSCSGLEQQFFCATFYGFDRANTASGKPDAVPAAEHNVRAIIKRRNYHDDGIPWSCYSCNFYHYSSSCNNICFSSSDAISQSNGKNRWKYFKGEIAPIKFMVCWITIGSYKSKF